ncbi:MAG TPA: CPBP family intramembrane glutamic endopeptidase, partial [Desulfatiglandales bacterium]|nr:CPBP family intramembrane glutamic endopeptidase [Desulfatiglandales bacterium]
GFRISDPLPGWKQYTIAGLMWVPTLATILTVRFITREEFEGDYLKLGSWKPYLASGLVIPLCFGLVYGLTWLLGLGQPDFTLKRMQDLMAASGTAPSTAALSTINVLGLFMITVIFAPIVNGLLAFGEEYGWRGYLLPKLMPMGKFKAYLLLGIIWGLWHAPLIWAGFDYPGYPVLGIITFIGVATAVGIFINELTLHYRSVFLASWIHGVFNSQIYGLWRVLFPTVNPVLGGFTGLVGIAVWFILGLMAVRVMETRTHTRESRELTQIPRFRKYS